MKGWIYIGVNSLAKEVLRIDSVSGDPDEQAKKLSNAGGLPGQIAVRYACWVDDYKSVEREVHEMFAKAAVVESPKWFRLEVPKAIEGIRQIREPIFEDSRVSGIPSISQSQHAEELGRLLMELNDLEKRPRLYDYQQTILKLNKALKENADLREEQRLKPRFIVCPSCGRRSEKPAGRIQAALTCPHCGVWYA